MRDKNQVMGRYLSDKDISGMLVVDQLWIWILGPKLIISSFSLEQEHDSSTPSLLLTSIQKRINLGLGERVRNVRHLRDIIVE